MIPILFLAVPTLLPIMEPHWQTCLFYEKEDVLQEYSIQYEGSKSHITWETQWTYQWIPSLWRSRSWFARMSISTGPFQTGFGHSIEETPYANLHRSNAVISIHTTNKVLYSLFIEKLWQECCISSILTLQWNRGDSYSMQMNFWLRQDMQFSLQQTLPLRERVNLTYGFMWPSKRILTTLQFPFDITDYSIGISQMPRLTRRTSTQFIWRGSQHD